jgi:hypothetical protein
LENNTLVDVALVAGQRGVAGKARQQLLKELANYIVGANSAKRTDVLAHLTRGESKKHGVIGNVICPGKSQDVGDTLRCQ